ncbi:MAG: helix-turn-helix transcriptional regulator [Alphaproteobacteria bacterium]|nr:helix-turn-helix transcriptional regulator [Alphaproteobacteria bacterium]
MDESQALLAFGALAGEPRLRIVRRLVRAGPKGMAAGDIAAAMSVSPSNMSFHLKELERAGMVASRREARSIIYAADYRALRGLIEFLMKDCCAGRLEVLQPAAGERPSPAASRKRAEA